MRNDQSSRAVPETGVVEELRAHAGFVENGGCVEHSMTDEASLLRRAADALEAKDRELLTREGWALHWQTKCQETAGLLSEARAEIGELKDRMKNSYFESYARELNYRLAAENETKRAERERDEAMAALREKEEARVALSRSLNHAAKVQVELEDRVKALEEALGPFGDAANGLAPDLPATDQVLLTVGGLPIAWVYTDQLRRARSVLSSVQPVSGSREQRGNEEVRS